MLSAFQQTRYQKLVELRLAHFYIPDDSGSVQHITRHIFKGVPQGGVVLNPLLFSICVADITQNVPATITTLQYADDIAVCTADYSIQRATFTIETADNQIQRNLHLIGLDIAPAKSALLVFNRKNNPPGAFAIKLENFWIQNSQSTRFLGIHLDQLLNFKFHINELCINTRKLLNIIKFPRGTGRGAHPLTLLSIYKGLIRSRMESCLPCIPKRPSLLDKMKRVQRIAARLALGLRNSAPNNVTLAEAKLPTLEHRAAYLGMKYATRIATQPTHFINDFLPSLSSIHHRLAHKLHTSPRLLTRVANEVVKFPPLLAPDYGMSIPPVLLPALLRLLNATSNLLVHS